MYFGSIAMLNDILNENFPQCSNIPWSRRTRARYMYTILHILLWKGITAKLCKLDHQMFPLISSTPPDCFSTKPLSLR